MAATKALLLDETGQEIVNKLEAIKEAISSEKGGYGSWSTGTWAQIAFMLEKHYAGEIDIEDFWAVGEERTIAMATFKDPDVYCNGSYNNPVPAQDVVARIIGFKHDALASDNTKKAAVSMQIVTRPSSWYARANSDYEYDKSSSTECDALTLWETSKIRKMLNTDYLGALPAELQNLIKVVTKKTCRGYNTNYKGAGESAVVQTTNDKIWLLSHTEFWGNSHLLGGHTWGTWPSGADSGNDGNQYEIYSTASGRNDWGCSYGDKWFRTSCADDGNANFFYVYGDDGEAGCHYSGADNSSDAFPGFAL